MNAERPPDVAQAAEGARPGASDGRPEAAPPSRASEDALIARWIEPHPNKGGTAEYRIVGRGVQMWALAAYFRTERGPTAEYLDQAARAYGLPREAAEAALAFYRRHQAVIDDRIDANAA